MNMSTGQIAPHPHSPAGAGGPGNFRKAHHAGVGFSVPNVGTTHYAPTAVVSPREWYLELVDSGLGKAQNGARVAGYVADGVRLISAAEAFRKYSWLKMAPIKNCSGNLRGIVISAKARAVYEWAGKTGKVVEALALLITFAKEAFRSQDEMAAIGESRDDALTKAAKYSALVSGICIRSLASLPADVLDDALWLLQKTKYANPGYWYDFATGQARAFDEGVEWARSAVQSQKTSVDTFTLNGNLYAHIQIMVNGKH
jgi:hypothetical protein